MSMSIFTSYVKLPEGTFPQFIDVSMGTMIRIHWGCPFSDKHTNTMTNTQLEPYFHIEPSHPVIQKLEQFSLIVIYTMIDSIYL